MRRKQNYDKFKEDKSHSCVVFKLFGYLKKKENEKET